MTTKQQIIKKYANELSNVEYSKPYLEVTLEYLIKEIEAIQEQKCEIKQDKPKLKIGLCKNYEENCAIKWKKQDKPVCEHKFTGQYLEGCDLIMHCETCGEIRLVNTHLEEIQSPPTQTTKHLDKLVVPEKIEFIHDGSIGNCEEKINGLIEFNKQLLISLKERE